MGRTRGTETSNYPQEEKSIEIPQVVASERVNSLNRVYVIAAPGVVHVGVVGRFWVWRKPRELKNSGLVESYWKVEP